MDINVESIEKYIKKIFGEEAELIDVNPLGGETYKKGLIKGYGYGTPLLIRVKKNGETYRYVLNTVRPGQFGHEYMSDRAAILIWSHTSFNKLDRHVKSIDLGYFTEDGELVSIDTPKEFFQLVEYIEGKEYFHDLENLAKVQWLSELDIKRAEVLAKYLANIHMIKKKDYNLYRRRIRELIGHGEAIMGLIDSYKGSEEFLEEDELKKIELKCVEWRWRIRDKGYRLCQVHGDFHPWNIIFTNDLDFILLDRSRGEWGEAADDVAALTINYLFFSLMKHGELRNTYLYLWNKFIETYLDDTGDEELLKVIQPFYAWRGLVVASPIWYPNLEYETRRKIFNFIHNILDTDTIDYKNIHTYFD